MAEISRITFPNGILLSLKFPSTSVTVPRFEFRILIFVPLNPSLLLEVTFPVIL
jgi:hypothetical protein